MIKKMDKEEEKMSSAVSTWVEGKQVGAIYIARDEGIWYHEDDHKTQGKLHLFYDTPLIHRDAQTNTLKFDCARCIAEIPSYMYPDIKEGDCYEISITTDKCRYNDFNFRYDPTDKVFLNKG